MGCSATQPSSYCTATIACRYGEVVCNCVNVCSGVKPPPGQERSWSCVKPQTVACPATTPAQDSACTASGLVCHYGTCGIATATCTSNKWKVVTLPPPP